MAGVLNGAHLISLNGTNIIGMSKPEVMALIAQAQRPKRFVFAIADTPALAAALEEKNMQEAIKRSLAPTASPDA